MVDNVPEINPPRERFGVRKTFDLLSEGLFGRVTDYYSRLGLLGAILDKDPKGTPKFYREAQYFTTDPDFESNPKINEVLKMVRKRMKNNGVLGDDGGYRFSISPPTPSVENPGVEDTKLGTMFDDGALKVIQGAYEGNVRKQYNTSSPVFAYDAPPVFKYKWTFSKSELTVCLSRVLGFGLSNDVPITFADLKRNLLGITTLRLLQTEFSYPPSESQLYTGRDWAVTVPLCIGGRPNLATTLKSYSGKGLEEYFRSLVVYKAPTYPSINGIETFVPLSATTALKNLLLALAFPTNMRLFEQEKG